MDVWKKTILRTVNSSQKFNFLRCYDIEVPDIKVPDIESPDIEVPATTLRSW